MWPVFTSPHYDLDGSGPDARGPLFFDEYVRIGGDGVTDSPNRLVSYRDPSLPRRVRDFPLSHPNSCVTSNGERVDVQFPVSADLSRAVVAKAGTASSYEEQVRALRRMGDSPDGHEIETLCVASTFGNADYNKARHGETALAWKSLDFRPVGRFHHWWANAVDNMVLAFGPKRRSGDWHRRRPGTERGALYEEIGAARVGPRADGAATAAGAGGGAARARRRSRKRSSDASSSANPGRIGDAAADDRDGSSSSVFSRTEPSFRVTSKYTALHWRRGDKCGKKSKRQASRNAGPVGHSFDAHGSGASQRCSATKPLTCTRLFWTSACLWRRCTSRRTTRTRRFWRTSNAKAVCCARISSCPRRRFRTPGTTTLARETRLLRRRAYGKDPGRAGGRRRARAGRDARRGRRGELHVRAHRAGAAVRPHAHVTAARRGRSTSPPTPRRFDERAPPRSRARAPPPPPPPRWASAKAILSRGDFFFV